MKSFEARLYQLLTSLVPVVICSFSCIFKKCIDFVPCEWVSECHLDSGYTIILSAYQILLRVDGSHYSISLKLAFCCTKHKLAYQLNLNFKWCMETKLNVGRRTRTNLHSRLYQFLFMSYFLVNILYEVLTFLISYTLALFVTRFFPVGHSFGFIYSPSKTILSPSIRTRCFVFISLTVET